MKKAVANIVYWTFRVVMTLICGAVIFILGVTAYQGLRHDGVTLSVGLRWIGVALAVSFMLVALIALDEWSKRNRK